MSTSTTAKGSSNQYNPECVLWMGLADGIVDEDLIKNAFSRSGHPCSKVHIKTNKDRSSKSGPFAFVEFKDGNSAKNALAALAGQPIPDFPDKTFRLNSANNNKSGGQGDVTHSARSNSMTHDAGRHSAPRSTPAWQLKPTSTTLSTQQFVNSRSHGHNQLQQPQRHQQQQQPQPQQPQYWRTHSSSRHVGHQQSQRNQQNHDNTIFVGNLNPEVDDEKLNSTFKSIYPSTIYAKVIRHPDGTSKEFGFVRFSLVEEYNSALTLPAEVKSKLGPELRISKAHPRPPYSSQRRGLSNYPASNGPSFSNGTDGLTVPASTSNDLSFQDVNSNSNIPNSSPSTISNNSNNSNNNVTRPSSVSASPAKPTVQPVQMQPHMFHPGYAAYPPLYYYPNFTGAEAYPGQFPHIFPSSHTLEGQPLYWQSWPSPPVDFVPRGAVHTTHPHPGTGDAIHSPYGQPHGPTWQQYLPPYPTLVPNENSDVSPDQMPTPSFDGPRVQQHVATAHHHV